MISSTKKLTKTFKSLLQFDYCIILNIEICKQLPFAFFTRLFAQNITYLDPKAIYFKRLIKIILMSL